MTQKLHSTDHSLKTRVSEELRWSPDVDADHVGVAVTEGAVTLSGEVETYAQKEAALDAAYRVEGVTGVADELVVKNRSSGREDVDIVRAAAKALAAHPTIPKGAVHLAVHDGCVLLSGSLPWRYQLDEADRAVRSTPGVRSVHNIIEIKPELPMAAEEAKRRILAALLRNAEDDAANIHVAVRGTTIELTGTVLTWDEFEQAGDAAWSTPGVTAVRNNLHVSHPEPGETSMVLSG